jgi:hypothetical protein
MAKKYDSLKTGGMQAHPRDAVNWVKANRQDLPPSIRCRPVLMQAVVEIKIEE